MPHLAALQVHDNSTGVAPGDAVPDPSLILEMKAGRIVWPRPDDLEALRRTPDWAKPIVEAALMRRPR